MISQYRHRCTVALRGAALVSSSINKLNAYDGAAEKQIKAFLSGEHRQLNFPIRMIGTPFQQCVWCVLQQIPYGTTRTYGEIATEIGNPRATRAVGMACNKNPLLLIIPCHRVLGANGKLTGFAYGTDAKQRLLELEKRHR